MFPSATGHRCIIRIGKALLCTLALVVASLMLPQPQVRAASAATQIQVPSSAQWVNTSITLSVGESLQVSATGSWSADPGDGPIGPDGYSQTSPDNFLNLTDLGACSTCASTQTPHWGALIGYIGDNPPAPGSYTSTNILPEAQKVFVVGSNFQSNAKLAGKLWLNFNDDAYSDNTGDNTGQVTATITATSSNPPGKLVVYLVGLGESLSTDDASKNNGYGYASSFYSSGDIQPYLQGTKEFKGAQSLVFSYRGFTNDGKPDHFFCWDTFNNQLSFDVALLNLQITQYLKGHPNTDVYLVSHSLGGVIAFSYMASLIENTHSTALENGGILKGVSINDSPLGGVTNDNSYENTIITKALTCDFQLVDFTSIGELQTLFNTASSSTHQGETASILNAFLGGRYITNQQVASDAMTLGVVTLVVGNDYDLLWRPNVCHVGPDFHSTEYLKEVGRGSNGGALYSRSFTSGSLNGLKECPNLLKTKAHHFDVLGKIAVEKAIWEAFTGRRVDQLKPVTT